MEEEEEGSPVAELSEALAAEHREIKGNLQFTGFDSWLRKTF